MSTPEFYVYDGDGGSNAPRRPSLDDVGGGAKINDLAMPPDPETMPTAEDENQQENLLVGLCRLGPVLQVWVIFSGGTPALASFRSMSNELLFTDITVTDDATGQTSVTVAADKLPAQSMPATVQAYGEVDRVWPEAVTGGWRVHTKLGATYTDMAFRIDFY